MSSDDPMAAGPAPWMRMWLDMTSGAMEACQAWAGATASPEPVRQIRSAMLEAWSDYWDQCLRSPMFLNATRQAVAQSTQIRKQFGEYLDRLYSESPVAGREDMEQLLRALRRSEERLLEQLEDVSARLEALDAGLDALAARLNGKGREPQPKPSRAENRSRRKRNRTGQPDPEEE